MGKIEKCLHKSYFKSAKILTHGVFVGSRSFLTRDHYKLYHFKVDHIKLHQFKLDHIKLHQFKLDHFKLDCVCDI